MTTENDLIRPLLAKAREDGFTEMILIAGQHPSLLKPRAEGGGMDHAVLTEREIIPNNDLAAYLNDLGVELERGYADGYTDEGKVQFFARSDRMGRFTVVFHLFNRPAQTTSA